MDNPLLSARVKPVDGCLHQQRTDRRVTTHRCGSRFRLMDLDAVSTFVAVAETGQFQAAADDLEITQQAASKRVATLERELGVHLFARTARGARLTVDGQALLPHARELLRAAERATAAVTPGRRALRIDVISRRIAPAGILYAFYQQRPDIELDVVALLHADAASALAEVSAGTLDATFRSLRDRK